MSPGERAAPALAGNRTANQEEAHSVIISRSGSNCVACRRPTPRWSAVCRSCLSWHFRLQGLATANALREG